MPGFYVFMVFIYDLPIAWTTLPQALRVMSWLFLCSCLGLCVSFPQAFPQQIYLRIPLFQLSLFCSIPIIYFYNLSLWMNLLTYLLYSIPSSWLKALWWLGSILFTTGNPIRILCLARSRLTLLHCVERMKEYRKWIIWQACGCLLCSYQGARWVCVYVNGRRIFWSLDCSLLKPFHGSPLPPGQSPNSV